MAYASGVQLSGLAGIVGAAVGGYIGYTQAGDVSNLTPIAGALILGGVGLVAGSAGAFLLKSLMQFVIYIIMFGVLVYVFQSPIEKMTGINPVAATLEFLGDFGLPVKSATERLVTDPS
jgi:predicted neutral ceramidase superfamily lipid hydrolase